MPKDVRFNSGFSGCDDRMKILKNEVAPRRLKDNENCKLLTPEEVLVSDDNYLFVDNNGVDAKVNLIDVLNKDGRVAVDWNETDEESPAFIHNNPHCEEHIFLEEDLVSLYTVGGVEAGTVFEKGSTIFDIVKEILGLRPGEKLAEIRAGVVDFISEESLPSEIVLNNLPELKVEPDTLTSTEFKFTSDNQYFLIAVSKNTGLKVNNIYQDTFKLGFTRVQDYLGRDLYFYDKPSTGEFDLRVEFGVDA